MRVHRATPTGDVTRLPIAMLQDERLTFLARGVLIDLLTREDGEDVNAEEIYQEARKGRGAKAEGRQAIRAAFAELERFGYLVRRRVQNTNGRWVTLMEVYDDPRLREAAPADPLTDLPLPHTAQAVAKARSRWTHYLYRHWDGEGNLLYVGVTDRPRARQRAHEANSRWMGLTAKTTVEEHPSREAVEVAEAIAIRTERPLFNLAGNESPDTQERLRRYLCDRNRMDLLPG